MRKILHPALCLIVGTCFAPVPGAAAVSEDERPATGGTAEAVTSDDRRPVAEGTGGAVATVDPDASRTAIEILRRGGNAADAAVAAAATLGVTEPHMTSIGGGGYLMYYEARTGRVHSLDARESAPAAMREDSFLENGTPIPEDEIVTSGLTVGVPSVVHQWETILRTLGTISLRQALRPAIRVARSGFLVDAEFNAQTALNQDRFADIGSAKDLFLPGGRPPPVGSVFRNPDLARTYEELARHGADWFYRGPVAREIVRTVKHPPAESSGRRIRPGLMATRDLAAYRTLSPSPTRSRFRGLEVYGMPPSSSGGTTVGEVLAILSAMDAPSDRVEALHRYLEASRLAFADRERYVGDPDFADVPVSELLSPGFARERACLIGPAAMAHPAAPGSPDGSYQPCQAPGAPSAAALSAEGRHTTHLVVSDRWGNVASYTISLGEIGGSGLVVPGRGFLLNSQLSGFTFDPSAGGPNLAGPGKRPRSSIAPTIVLRDGRPLFALGSPGGTPIITTVIQILLNRVDFGMPLPEALAAPRASQLNLPVTLAEPGFTEEYGSALTARGHAFEPPPWAPWPLGAATALEFLDRDRVLAVAEPTRLGGGSALVVRP
ncbi:gamma-glutamyltransferase [Nonomuraea africana]|uniref:Glutathione hydrolase proenzyme n=1 Tax=Nonomuraea africana TaxID=46171 RepID=A0ABR9KEL4_9ACTN|nr:gamma-glutamyltransferase [Nonomuraea africana]MBE1560468.1 gamma-glutamyltranspeptidase/glutathione hydrolase [Nonomuraea africana]